jgi:hypothetical protein
MSRCHRFQIAAVIPKIALAVILAWFLTLMPMQAQERAKATISLDGRPLFEVSAAGQFSAENRADDANLILREAVRSPELVEVQIIQTNELPVIQVNNRHLLTVTSQDTPPGRSKQEQAEIWVQRITC